MVLLRSPHPPTAGAAAPLSGASRSWPPQVRFSRRPTAPPIAAKKNSRAPLELGAKALKRALSAALAVGVSFSCFVGSVDAKVGVNKPELLPKEFSTVIDVAGFLSSGQENRLCKEIEDLERDTGYKLRVLAQNYPDTPGLAIKDFWQVDDRTVVFVADPTFGNIINFNVGSLVDLNIPRNFWSRVAGKYGNMFYWKEKGEDASIEAAVMAISRCLREPVGSNCSEHAADGLTARSNRLQRWKMQPLTLTFYQRMLGPVEDVLDSLSGYQDSFWDL